MIVQVLKNEIDSNMDWIDSNLMKKQEKNVWINIVKEQHEIIEVLNEI